MFSGDGKYLIFESDRDFNPIYGRLEWNHVYTRMGGIYLALLQQDTPSPFLPADEAVNSDKEEEADKTSAKDTRRKTPKPKTRR